jgi:pyridoxal phosphate enzyme (YggS family)
MDADPERILANLAAVRRAVAQAAETAGRDPAEVLIVAAAKTMGADAVRCVVDAGVRAIGENYVNELRALHGEVPGARWHFIGALQTNSAHHVAALTDMVETVAGGRATGRLARRAAEAGRRIEALIEVDFTGSRAGVAPEEVAGAAARIAAMEGLDLRGLMALAPIGATAEDARPWFRHLRELRDRVREGLPQVVELSMGMSLDYRVAIEEGATMVRIGTALFGPRTA